MVFWSSLTAQGIAHPSTPINSPDRSDVHIVIKPSDYSSFNIHGKSGGNASHRFVSLPEISRHTLALYFGAKTAKDITIKTTASTDEWLKDQQIEKKFQKPAGVFVTLSKRGKTRACWGSVYAREATIAKETEIATLGALSKDYRYKPISKTELADLKIQVTVISAIQAVSDIRMIDPFKNGILVRSGGRGGVILPGEAVDAYYEFVLARLKAGIKPNEPCQIYKLKAEIYD
jgi:AMMECR1 domain-containing protein